MIEREEYIKIPLIKNIYNINSIEEGKYTDYEEIIYNNINNINLTKKFFAYQVKEDRMEPQICKGDVVIFEKTNLVSDGDICIVKIANEEMSIRKFGRFNSTIFFRSNNIAYDTTFYSYKDLNNTIEIIGRVVRLIRKYS